ncbi:intercellular adhesion molecule 2 [Esox lucius]|uniref:Ig-like domain-containing protein n=1 Tax=Esox lucius TaxID=8010 RepID=A0A6Q2X0P0_ESOLU|nr:intercellular adhesion molecule 2 [Esox lucius]
MVKGFIGFLTLAVLMFTGGSTRPSCPLELNPPSVVVKYGDPVSVNCSTSCTDHEGMGWEATQGGTAFQLNAPNVTWIVDNLEDWTIKPMCYITTSTDQVTKTLPVILYKTPDNMSISLLDHFGPMLEGTEYRLQCDIQNVAPVQNLIVKWYKGNEFLLNVTYSNSTKTPVDVSPTLTITPSSDDDGAQYRCEAELDLGPEGPQPPPTVSSEPLNVTVYYPPTFLSSETEILSISVGEDISLNCTATGRPTPHYSWNSSLHIPNNPKNEALLTPPSELPGNYTCIASNQIGSISKLFIVILTPKGRITFWAFMLSALILASAIGIGYVFLKRKLGPNSLI